MHLAFDPSMKAEEATALLRFAKEGVWAIGPALEPPLLLNATDAAKYLGMSPDGFLRARASHPNLLAPLETHNGGKMWAKAQLVKFSSSHLRDKTDPVAAANAKPDITLSALEMDR
jgi:hypothetical protein